MSSVDHYLRMVRLCLVTIRKALLSLGATMALVTRCLSISPALPGVQTVEWRLRRKRLKRQKQSQKRTNGVSSVTKALLQIWEGDEG
jgi:type II secretory pathway component PulJ